MGDVLRLGDSNYYVPSHRVGPGLGNHWSDGIGYPDWSLDGGSDTYRDLLGTAGVMQNSTGGFYTMDDGVKRDVKIGTNSYYTYQGQILNGGMTAQDLSSLMQMSGGDYAYWINLSKSPGIKATWHEVTLGLLNLSDKFGQQISDTRFGFMLRRKIIDVKRSQNDVSSLVYSIKVFKHLVKSKTHYDLKKHGYSQKSIGIYSLYYGQKIQIRSLW